MPNKFYAFFLSSIAGIFTLIGFLSIFINKNRGEVISKALSFSAGVMITLSIIDLLPNSLKLLATNNKIYISFFLTFIGFIGGIVISNIINQKVENNQIRSNNLYKIGIISMIIIIIHNIPEGIITYIAANDNIRLGIKLSLAIALHNIPEGISISIPIYYSTNNKLKTFIYILIASISEPFGALISYLFLYKFLNNSILGILYGLIAGVMINISIEELLKEAIKYKKEQVIKYFIYGILIMTISTILIN